MGGGVGPALNAGHPRRCAVTEEGAYVEPVEPEPAQVLVYDVTGPARVFRGPSARGKEARYVSLFSGTGIGDLGVMRGSSGRLVPSMAVEANMKYLRTSYMMINQASTSLDIDKAIKLCFLSGGASAFTPDQLCLPEFALLTPSYVPAVPAVPAARSRPP